MKTNSHLSRPFLNRYTSLPILLDILVGKQITLLSPSSWEDRNDAYYLEQYKAQKKLKTVLALCFSEKRETFHHWKIFSDGSSGVCIEFDKEELIGGLDQNIGYRCRRVNYRFITDVRSKIPSIDDWPFLKRKPFEDENEFRIVYENEQVDEQIKQIPIRTKSIRKITLSPWIPETVAKTVIDVIRQLPDCRPLTINRSNLLNTAVWKSAIRGYKAQSIG